MRAMPADPPCPCGLPARLSACCGRWHAGPLQGLAPDAAALMRSRYSAWVLQLGGYLLDTWHPRTRPADIEPDQALTWIGLDVVDVVDGAADDTGGIVEFRAHWRSGEGRSRQSGTLHERSTFARRGGRWVYLGAETRV